MGSAVGSRGDLELAAGVLDAPPDHREADVAGHSIHGWYTRRLPPGRVMLTLLRS